MNVVQMTANENRETQIILVSDLLARMAMKPLTSCNLERVHTLSRKLMQLSAQT